MVYLRKNMNLSHDIKTFFAGYKRLQYKKGEVIIRAQDEPNGVFYLTRGYVKMYSITPDGKEFTLNIYKPASYFPMSWAIADVEVNYYYEALTDVTTLRAPKRDVVEKFINTNPELLSEFTKRLVIGLDGILTRIQYLFLSDAYHKVAMIFMLLARRFGKEVNGKILIRLPVTHQEIASLAGLTRETTSIEIKNLRESGLISRRGRVWQINNLNKLRNESILYIDDKPLPYSF